MDDNETIVRRFVADWSRLDPDRLVAYFTDDGVYHNMSMKKIDSSGSVRLVSTA